MTVLYFNCHYVQFEKIKESCIRKHTITMSHTIYMKKHHDYLVPHMYVAHNMMNHRYNI
jgi:hypothetical protein